MEAKNKRKKEVISLAEWKRACEKLERYLERYPGKKQWDSSRAIVCSGDKVNPSNKNRFGDVWKKFKNKELEDDDDQTFNLVFTGAMIKIPARQVWNISWTRMKLKCLHWEDYLDFDAFNCSDGWVRDALSCNGLIKVDSIEHNLGIFKYNREDEVVVEERNMSHTYTRTDIHTISNWDLWKRQMF